MQCRTRALNALLNTFMAAALSLLLLAPVVAADEPPAAPLSLRAIMQELGANMLRVTDAISREDWAAIEKIALHIAHHPHPAPSEMKQIFSYLGKDVATFKSFDQQSHEAAQQLAAAAAKKDGAAVISAFAAVQTGCLGCHQQFRAELVKHLHAKD